MKTCPSCGFQGDQTHCPDDGERLLTPDELAAHAPAEPTRVPAVDAHDKTMAPPQEVTSREHGKAVQKRDDDPDAELRGEDFGNWAEPEVKKKKKDPMIGRTISGRYEVLGLLGKGGMGAVYKAYQSNVQRTIALKVLLKEFAENETVIKRFHQEALAASRLVHPNTITVYDFGQTEDHVLYIAMEYLRGESLAQALAREPVMSPRRAVHIMRQVCKSLAEAHGAGIIHRDLKPDNIFLTEIEGERDFAKVLDFGVAKLKEYEGKEGTLTQAGMIFGTPKYMSPEQARSGQIDHRSDVYALGVILYEMLIGRPPFGGDNPLSILIAHVNEQPKSFVEVDPDHKVPGALEAVVFKALAKDVSERHASVDELLEELDAVNELLQGASYDSVRDRLPATIPGRKGAPSLVGPAVVPHGSEGTAPGAIGVGGDTIVLDENGQPVQRGDTTPLVADLDLTAETYAPDHGRSSSPPLALIAAVLVPLIGGGAWFALSGGDEKPKEPVARPAVVDAAPVAEAKKPDAAVVAVKQPDATAVAAAKPAPDAGEEEPEKPTVRKPPKEVVVSTADGSRAKIIDSRTGKRIGVTPFTVAFRGREKKVTLQRAGYYDEDITLSAGDGSSRKVKMRAKPTQVARETPVRVQPVAVPKPPPPKPTNTPEEWQ